MAKESVRTKRLELSPLTDEDKEAFLSICRDCKVKQTYMLPDFASKEEEDKFFSRLQRLSLDEKRFVYGLHHEGECIGFLNDVHIEGNEIELGYFIASKEWGKGYATEAMSAMIEYLFKRGLQSIVAAHFESNLASASVMKKCGMRLSNKEEDLEYRGKTHRCIYYGITPESKTYFDKVKSLLGKKATVYVDRPIGYDHKGIHYLLNYGYIKDFKAPDEEYQDAYILDEDKPLESFEGTVLGILHRIDDNEDKLVVGRQGHTREEIEKAVEFQERYFQHYLFLI